MTAGRAMARSARCARTGRRRAWASSWASSERGGGARRCGAGVLVLVPVWREEAALPLCEASGLFAEARRAAPPGLLPLPPLPTVCSPRLLQKQNRFHDLEAVGATAVSAGTARAAPAPARKTGGGRSAISGQQRPKAANRGRCLVKVSQKAAKSIGGETTDSTTAQGRSG